MLTRLEKDRMHLEGETEEEREWALTELGGKPRG